MTPILDDHTLEFISRSPAQTQRLGARLGGLMQGGDVICLEGTLGSGKTCLAQGIGRGWGIGQTLISPTYVLVREYTRPVDSVRLYHVDLYRVSNVDETISLGIDESLGETEAVFIIEWAERARPLIPHDHLWVKLDFANRTHRALYFAAEGGRHKALLEAFRHTAFGA